MLSHSFFLFLFSSQTTADVEWDKEFLGEAGLGGKSEDFWSNLEDAWSVLKNDTSDLHPWLQEYEKNEAYKLVSSYRLP